MSDCLRIAIPCSACAASDNDRSQDTSECLRRTTEPRGPHCNASRVRVCVTSNPVGDPIRTVATLTSNGGDIGPDLLRFLSPLGWEHINLTGDYTWPRTNHIKPGRYSRYDGRQNLSVPFFTFSQATPVSK